MESFLPKDGTEFIYYDVRFGIFDQPQDTSLWNIGRFVEEVEQVRKALGLNKDNGYLLGHSGRLVGAAICAEISGPTSKPDHLKCDVQLARLQQVC
jgi:hypothetical protein